MFTSLFCLKAYSLFICKIFENQVVITNCSMFLILVYLEILF